MGGLVLFWQARRLFLCPFVHFLYAWRHAARTPGLVARTDGPHFGTNRDRYARCNTIAEAAQRLRVS